MGASDIWLLVFAALLVPIAGLLAAVDAAVSVVSAARATELQREGRRGAASLAAIAADRSRYINLLLLLRLTAEMTAAVTVAVVAVGLWGFHTLVAVVVIVVMVLLSYVVIGVLPRTLGRQHPYAIGLASAGATRALARVLAPISRLLIAAGNALVPGRPLPAGPFTSDVELREMVALAAGSGVVLKSEQEMLQSVFDLGGTIAREVMVPRTDVVWIESVKTLRQAVHLADRSGFSRIPVIGSSVDDVLGVIYVKDLISRLLSLAPDDRGPIVTELMRPAVFVPESKAVDSLLREMQRDRTHVAMVIDEYGGLAGLVTMEDIVEEIVGEITDEYDAEAPAPIEHQGDGVVRVSARLPVEDLGEIFDVELPADDVETVGGLLAQLLGRVALPGAHADIEGIRLQAEGGIDRRGRHRMMAVRAWRIDEENEDVGSDVIPDTVPIDTAPTGSRYADGNQGGGSFDVPSDGSAASPWAENPDVAAADSTATDTPAADTPAPDVSAADPRAAQQR